MQARVEIRTSSVRCHEWSRATSHDAAAPLSLLASLLGPAAAGLFHRSHDCYTRGPSASLA